MTYDDLLTYPPFAIDQAQKERLLSNILVRLTRQHMDCCAPYRRIMESLGYREESVASLADIPFLPVPLFKELELVSVSQEQIFKIMTSSGTTGQRVSKIFLDRRTAANQQKTLTRIVADFTGAKRLPMLIIDCPSVLRNREMFSARGAGILGFSIFGRQTLYALDNDMRLRLSAIEEFLSLHRDERIFLFGFTFIVWKHFYQALAEKNIRLDFHDALLVHGGGWKKLQSEAVSPEKFKACLREFCNIREVYDYYGMAEQTGCISMECEAGHLHTSTYADVIVRRGEDFSAAGIGETGILQLLSALPESYPGHSLLTEDEGTILGIDDCPCGRKGKYFRVNGRLAQAETRGCSDTYGR